MFWKGINSCTTSAIQTKFNPYFSHFSLCVYSGQENTGKWQETDRIKAENFKGKHSISSKNHPNKLISYLGFPFGLNLENPSYKVVNFIRQGEWTDSNVFVLKGIFMPVICCGFVSFANETATNTV